MSEFVELENLIANGYISKQKHPSQDLWIYNYTPKTQFEGLWNEWTLRARGLILDANFKVVARPFGKFFNLEELEKVGQKLPFEDFKVYEKLDGSLGVLYWFEGSAKIATRGSFTSEQAIFANNFILPKYTTFLERLDQSFTYLLEIIYPQNRIVLDYKDQQKLVLLAAIETQSGLEKDISEINWPDKAEIYNGIKDLEEIKSLESHNQEGFVIRFKSGFRVKYKFAEYKRLHRILTGINKKDIWEKLKNRENMEELLNYVPDEFYNWVKETILEIETNFDKIFSKANSVFLAENLDQLDRKLAAQIILEKYKPLAVILFSLLDKKDPREIIFKLIKPVANKPFKVDMEG